MTLLINLYMRKQIYLYRPYLTCNSVSTQCIVTQGTQTLRNGEKYMHILKSSGSGPHIHSRVY